MLTFQDYAQTAMSTVVSKLQGHARYDCCVKTVMQVAERCQCTYSELPAYSNCRGVWRPLASMMLRDIHCITTANLDRAFISGPHNGCSNFDVQCTTTVGIRVEISLPLNDKAVHRLIHERSISRMTGNWASSALLLKFLPHEVDLIHSRGPEVSLHTE